MRTYYESDICKVFIWAIWWSKIELKIRDQTRKKNNCKLLVWPVISSCSWNCIFGKCAFLAYIVLQLLIGLESPNKDSKTPNRDSLYWIFSLNPNRVHPLIRNIYISILSSGYHPHRGFPLARASLVNKYGVLSYHCAWLMLLFSITCLLSYVWFKVINNIQLATKVFELLIHPPSH